MYAVYQTWNNKNILVGLLIAALTMGPFNVFGSLLTKISTSAHRATICSLRTVLVWAYCLYTGQDRFRKH